MFCKTFGPKRFPEGTTHFIFLEPSGTFQSSSSGLPFFSSYAVCTADIRRKMLCNLPHLVEFAAFRSNKLSVNSPNAWKSVCLIKNLHLFHANLSVWSNLPVSPFFIPFHSKFQWPFLSLDMAIAEHQTIPLIPSSPTPSSSPLLHFSLPPLLPGPSLLSLIILASLVMLRL